MRAQLRKKLALTGFANKKFSNPKKNQDCSELEVDKWIISDFVVNKIVPVVGVHPYPIDELMLMVSSVCWTQPTHIFEWGTHVGKSARIFYETTRAFKLQTEIHSFDLPDEVEHVEHPKSTRGSFVKGKKGVFLYQVDGLKTSFEIFNKSKQDNKRAFFYVDGDHSYETVKKELNAINANIANPFILLHDTFFQSPESRYNIGPHQALAEFLNLHKEFEVADTMLGLPGMSFIFKTKA